MSRNKGGGGGSGGGEAATGAGAPADPMGEVKGFIKKFIDWLKKMLPAGVDLNVIASLFNPVLDESAESVAEKVKGYVTKYQWLGSKGMASIIGGFAAMIENAGDEQESEPARVAFKKAADWFETFSRELGKHAGKAKSEVSPELAKTLAALDAGAADLATEAVRLFLLTPADRREEMSALQNARAEDYHEFRELLVNGKPEPEVKKPAGVPFMKQVAGVAKSAGNAVNAQLVVLNTALAPLAADAKTRADAEVTRNRLRRSGRKNSWMKSLLLFPLKALTWPWK